MTLSPIRTLVSSRYALSAAALIALAGCTVLTTGATVGVDNEQKAKLGDHDSDHTVETITLTISAAASLQNALSELQPLFEQAYPHTRIFYNWGGSGTLQRQIEQGAPADLFFSASTRQMNELGARNLILPGSKQLLLRNQLVLITPYSSAVKGFLDLEGAKTIAAGEFETVPVGQYTKATLSSQRLLQSLEPQLVFFNNVRGVLAAVESGNADAGFVYETDARLSSQIKVAAIAPIITHPPIHYPIAVLQRSPHPEAAQQYIDFLTTPEAIAVFQRFGFETPGACNRIAVTKC